MYTKEEIIKNITSYINNKIDEMSINSSLVMFLRPVLQRASKKVICKIDKMLDFLADEKGMIDAEAILGEMANNLVSSTTKSYPEVFDGLSIGGGKISIEIPFINKEVVFTKEDIEDLKRYISK